jgi:protein-tyrosine-phosphatase
VRPTGLAVVMDGQQAREIRARFGLPPRRVVLLGDFDPDRTAPRAIPDPFDEPDDVFDEVYARIERCAAGLADALAAAWRGSAGAMR